MHSIHVLPILAAMLLPPRGDEAAPPKPPEHILHWNVAVLVFEGVELLDFAGPLETFSQTRSFDSPMTVYTVGATKEPLRTNNIVQVVPDFSIADCPPPDILVIPGGETRALDGNTPLGRFMREQVPRVEIAFSVCNAAFCLADAGFLDGLEATTFHSMVGWLRTAAPTTTVHADRRFVDNGHIVTAAGVSAGIDGALHLVHRLLGADAARKVASRMEYRWADDPGDEPMPADPIARARLHWYAGDWAEALADYRTIVAEHPDDATALGRLGTCIAFTRGEGGGLAELERAVSLGASTPVLFHALGFARKRAGDTQGAIDAFERVLQLDAGRTEARWMLGKALCDAGRWAEAGPHLESAWDASIGGQEVIFLLARARLASGDRDAALRALERGVDCDGFAAAAADPSFDALRDDARFKTAVERAAARPQRQ